MEAISKIEEAYSNFSFLAKNFSILERTGVLAEGYLYSDYNTCIFKLGALGELMVKEIFRLGGLKQITPASSNTHFNRINTLLSKNIINNEIHFIFDTIRDKRNKAVHDGYGTFSTCEMLMRLSYTLCVWFMRAYGKDDTFAPRDFVMPEDNSKDKNYQKLLAEIERLAAQLEKAQEEALAEQARREARRIAREQRREQAESAARKIRFSEEEARYLIEEQLRRVGWEADSQNLRYSKGTRPEEGRNMAIAQWPTDSALCKWGSVDYALFAGLKLVAVVEARADYKDVVSSIDNQCREYSMAIKDEHLEFVIDTWGDYRVPFLFATNGKPYLKEHETRTGVWFRDVRHEGGASKALQGWIDPQGLLDMLETDIAAADRRLRKSSYDLLRDKDGLNLRPYQIEAIEAAEAAVMQGRQTALLSMASGTGKTRTVLGMIYRFLKTGRFKRILFLVDRTALGDQVLDVFKEVKIEDLLTLDQIYEIKHLDYIEIDREAKVHLATVQSLVKRIIYNYSENDNETGSMPSVTDYDLIIVDEAHRGYILDRETGGGVELYSSQADYVSRYRSAIEYFDAVKIALTATPVLHTAEIFGKPVFEYTYRRAVIEGYLVNHSAPRKIVINLQQDDIKRQDDNLHQDDGNLHQDDGNLDHDDGILHTVSGILHQDDDIFYQDGIVERSWETIATYDLVTGEITNSDELADELGFNIESFNRQAITEDFSRAALEEIAPHINPEGSGKTLIYAVDDNHADLIVTILKEIYGPLCVSNETSGANDAIMKITGSIGGGDPERVLEAVKRFKNEMNPRIVVTVDLLTTGIDVPEITTLVFMRRVRSRILFEQMLGRATRLCPSIGKTHFNIYDPIGVYESMKAVSTMKPVAQTGSATTVEDVSMSDYVDMEAEHTLDAVSSNKEERIRGALEKLRNNHDFTKVQHDWLDRIEKTLLSETIVHREIFDSGAFRTHGGFARINKIFADKLEDHLQELNNYLNEE